MATRPDPAPASPPPARRDEMLWMATKGTKWFLRRSVNVIPYLLSLAVREALIRPEGLVAAAGAESTALPDSREDADPAVD